MKYIVAIDLPESYFSGNSFDVKIYGKRGNVIIHAPKFYLEA